MSKGGAGKVYFVLYLAVILELLIIFIERDEAEEHLLKQQKQAIAIVQTILSQLQTGSGTTGITTKPKDNIVLSRDEQEANARTYEVIVSVGDPKAELTYQGKTIRGDDIPVLEYYLSHIGNPELAEEELGADTADIVDGNVIFKAELGTETEGGYSQPTQTFGTVIPALETEQYFTLNEEETAQQVARGRNVKVFNVNFMPKQGEGWYRLRFFSQTNKIMGVSGGEPSEDDTVRIGNVKLTVKQLSQVQEALEKQRPAGEPPTKVEEYITTLLEPDAYKTLDENKGYTSIDVRVMEPEVQDPADPVAEILVPRDTIYWYNIAPFQVPVKLGPREGTRNVQNATLVAVNEETGNYVAKFEVPSQEGVVPIIARAENAGKVQVSEKYLKVETPELVGGERRFRGRKAVVGRVYNPSTEWASTSIPAEHYQTVVDFNGNQVFSSTGINFKPSDLPDDLMVTEATKEVDTYVYWKPGGTANRDEWVKVLSSKPGEATVSISGIDITYQPPTHNEGFEFDFILSQKSFEADFSPIVLSQTVGTGRTVGVTANATCAECSEYGLSTRLTQIDDKQWNLHVEVVDASKLNASINGKRFEVAIDMSGKGGATGIGFVTFTVKVVAQ